MSDAPPPPAPRTLSRREMLRLCAAGAGAAALAACGGKDPVGFSAAARSGVLLSRPAAPTVGAELGLSPLGLASSRDGLLYVPAGYDEDVAAPLVLLLHGAGGTASGIAEPFLPLADAAGLILLVPDSRGRTWDRITGAFGPDVAYIDEALAYAFARCNVDPARVAAAGFSDGASYALSLGMTNGELLPRVVAFSPGFAAPGTRRGTPRFFITHGVSDPVLPIDQCSRRIVPELQALGYDVRYEEFAGGHIVPLALATEAMGWVKA